MKTNKFIKQAEIKAKQAENWMRVCHKAMGLFTGSMWRDKEPVHVICDLLDELAQERGHLFIPTAGMKVGSGVVFDESSHFPPQSNAQIVNLEPSQIRLDDEPGMKASDYVKLMDHMSQKYRWPKPSTEQIDWFNGLVKDPTTRGKICDSCGVAQGAEESAHEWIAKHSNHHTITGPCYPWK